MQAKEAIKKVVGGKDLSGKEMTAVFRSIMTGKFTPSQIASFLTALRIKGETVEEITAAARVMRNESVRIKVKPGPVVDTCGTGGSGLSTFNFSTAAAFVTAGCGVKVAKHGNRSASGRCGSADVLEKLGVKLDVPPRFSEKCVNTIGIGFLFAPIFHRSMKYALIPRKEIGIRTIFNLLGPLCNPASPDRQVVAVYDASLTGTIAEVLKNLGVKRAFVAHGADGLDEITITGKTRVSELDRGKVRTYSLAPSDFGFRKAPLSEITGGSPEMNSRMMKALFAGKKGPVRDMTVMNSAMALVAAGKAGAIREAVKMAEFSIDSGAAAEKLDQLRCATCNGYVGVKGNKR